MVCDPPIVAPDAPLAEVAWSILEAPCGAAVVLEGTHVVGLLARERLERALRERQGDGDEGSVRAWMVHHPETVDPDASLEEAALLFLHSGLDHVPVTAGGEVVGLLSRRAVEGLVSLEDCAPRGV